jgi:hypothetical protein
MICSTRTLLAVAETLAEQPFNTINPHHNQRMGDAESRNV